MRRGRKKALSPVVATVLLIALVLVLAAIIFLWARGFISEQIEKMGQPAENICEQISFEIEYIPDQGSNTIGIDIRNTGNIYIREFDIKKITGGNSETESFSISVAPGEAIPAHSLTITGNPDEIIIYPKITGSVKGKNINKPFTCVEHGERITL